MELAINTIQFYLRQFLNEKKLLHRTIIVWLTLGFSIAWADSIKYECKIINVYAVNEAGDLTPHNSPLYTPGSTFHVQRDSGAIVGGPLSNSRWPSIRVLSSGSESMPFVVVSETQPVLDTSDTKSSFLHIDEYGTHVSKAFRAVDLFGDVYTGYCQ